MTETRLKNKKESSTLEHANDQIADMSLHEEPKFQFDDEQVESKSQFGSEESDDLSSQTDSQDERKSLNRGKATVQQVKKKSFNGRSLTKTTETFS